MKKNLMVLMLIVGGFTFVGCTEESDILLSDELENVSEPDDDEEPDTIPASN